jgi:hypothetical protein
MLQGAIYGDKQKKWSLIKIKDFSGQGFFYGYKLILSSELLEYWGETPVCQKCHKIINLPCFFCPEGNKLYCVDCKNIETCIYQRYSKNHEHKRIIKITTEEKPENDTN